MSGLPGFKVEGYIAGWERRRAAAVERGDEAEVAHCDSALAHNRAVLERQMARAARLKQSEEAS